MRINLAITDVSNPVPFLLRDMDIVLSECTTPAFKPDEEWTGTTPPSGWNEGTHLYVRRGTSLELVQAIRRWAGEEVREIRRGTEIHPKEKLDNCE